MAGEKQPVRKKVSFLMLPDDLLFSCLARVSRLYYHTLSLVSKRFRSLIASAGLYETRKLLGCTESCLYVFIRFPLFPQFPQDSNPTRWFTLCRRPIQISDPNPNPNPNHKSRGFDKKSFDNRLISIPKCNYVHMNRSNLLTVGYNIYKIGGHINGLPSSRVFFMDCRSHTWDEAPSMRVAREFPRATVLDGKIYVVDSSRDLNFSKMIECFDPKTQIWEHLPSPDVEIGMTYISQILARDGRLYMFGNKRVVYKPKENRWDEDNMDFSWDPKIDNVLYNHTGSKNFEWYDYEKRSWRNLEGLEKLPTLPTGQNCVRVVDYGGKFAVLWEKVVGKKGKNIWCAVFSLEKRKQYNVNEIYGKVEWCDVVLTIPKSCSVLKLLAVTL